MNLARGPKHDAVATELLAVYGAAQKLRAKLCAVAAVESPGSDAVQEYAIPDFWKPANVEFPECPSPDRMSVMEEYCELFWTTPGATEVSHHFIPRTGTPVRVPPWRIPVHYQEEVKVVPVS